MRHLTCMLIEGLAGGRVETLRTNSKSVLQIFASVRVVYLLNDIKVYSPFSHRKT